MSRERYRFHDAIQLARTKVLDEHVRVGHERREQSHTLGLTEVERDTPLVEVEVEVHAAAFWVRDVAWERPHRAAGVADSRRLHLDYIRPKIGQQARAICRGDAAAK